MLSAEEAAIYETAEREITALPSRSNKREVRNPVLALRTATRLQQMDPDTKKVLALLFKDLALDARERAAECWRKHKAPMAAYWKAVSVYAGHIAKVLR